VSRYQADRLVVLEGLRDCVRRRSRMFRSRYLFRTPNRTIGNSCDQQLTDSGGERLVERGKLVTSSRQGATDPDPVVGQFPGSRSAVLIWLEAKPVIDRVLQFLFEPEVSFGGLDRDMPEQELDLLQFPAS
jgi:hypothetical protein